MKELAVIIPMYNEELNARRCVTEVCHVLQGSLPGAKLIVVDDGSRDATSRILRELQEGTYPLTLAPHPTNRGYGAALLTGFQQARREGFVFGLAMDSDLTNDPAMLPAFAAKLQQGSYDLVKASRFVAGGGMKGVPWRRRMMSVLGNLVASVLFRIGIRDCTNGFHAVRLDLIVDERFNETGFAFLLEELFVLKRKGARTVEIPYILTARSLEDGVSKFPYAPRTFWRYFKYALYAFLTRSPAHGVDAGTVRCATPCSRS